MSRLVIQRLRFASEISNAAAANEGTGRKGYCRVEAGGLHLSVETMGFGSICSPERKDGNPARGFRHGSASHSHQESFAVSALQLASEGINKYSKVSWPRPCNQFVACRLANDFLSACS